MQIARCNFHYFEHRAMNCNWEQTAEKPWPTYRCTVHGHIVEVRGKMPESLDPFCERARAQLAAGRGGQWPVVSGQSPSTSHPTNGPGDCLCRAIERWSGEEPKLSCGCRSRIARMNAWGPDGCRKHLDEIVGWLVEEATKRGWRSAKLPGARWAVKRMVLGAIAESEKAE